MHLAALLPRVVHAPQEVRAFEDVQAAVATVGLIDGDHAGGEVRVDTLRVVVPLQPQSNRGNLTRLTSQTWTPATSGMQVNSRKLGGPQFMHDPYYQMKTQDSRQHELKRSGDDEDQK